MGSAIAVSVVKEYLDRLSHAYQPLTVLLDGCPRNREQAEMFKKEIGDVRGAVFLTCSPETTASRRGRRGKREDSDSSVAAARYQGYLDETLPTIEYLKERLANVETICADADGNEGWLAFKDTIVQRFRSE